MTLQTEFAGLAAIVTGGGSGIGLATAQMLAARGCSVVCLDLDASQVPAPLTGLACDVASTANVNQAVAEAAAHMDGIDIVVNNAGIGALGGIADNEDEEWHRVFDINVLGMKRVTLAALPWLRRSQHASVVNMGSAVASMGLPNRVLYSTTKGAVLSFTRALAADLITEGIRVNCVTPGVVDTPWQRRAIELAPDPSARRRELEGFQPGRRLALADEVAAAVVYLAGPLSKATSGINLPVDDGLQNIFNLNRANAT